MVFAALRLSAGGVLGINVLSKDLLRAWSKLPRFTMPNHRFSDLILSRSACGARPVHIERKKGFSDGPGRIARRFGTATVSHAVGRATQVGRLKWAGRRDAAAVGLNITNYPFRAATSVPSANNYGRPRLCHNQGRICGFFCWRSGLWNASFNHVHVARCYDPWRRGRACCCREFCKRS